MRRRELLQNAVLGTALGSFPGLFFVPRARAGGTDEAALQAKLEALAHKARPGRLSATVVDLETGRRWAVDGDWPAPMMSVFKAPLGAAVFAAVDRGAVSIEDKVTIERADLRGGASRIAKNFQGERQTFTVGELLQLGVSLSDNTAADALMAHIGGPEAVTGFLRDHGIEALRVDIDERTIEAIFNAGGPTKGETGPQRDARLQRGVEDFLADPRNRSTPDAAALFLEKLWRGELLSPASTKRLLELMYGQTRPLRLAAGLPQGARLAHKSGTSVTRAGITAAFNDIGIVTLPGGRTAIVAAFLTGSTASRDARTEIFAELARAVTAELSR